LMMSCKKWVGSTMTEESASLPIPCVSFIQHSCQSLCLNMKTNNKLERKFQLAKFMEVLLFILLPNSCFHNFLESYYGNPFRHGVFLLVTTCVCSAARSIYNSLPPVTRQS
jgi:hypothetical protein